MEMARPRLKSHMDRTPWRDGLLYRPGCGHVQVLAVVDCDRIRRSLAMSVIPYLTIAGGRGAEAADFYTKLFDAEPGTRMPAEDGKRLMHCALQFAGNWIYLS